jgi:hypothetical protein
MIANNHPQRLQAMNIRFLLVAVLLTTVHLGLAADIPIEPSGIYKDIDVRLSIDTVKALRDFKGEKQMKVANAVIAKPEEFSPPVLHVLSSVLFEQGKKDDAVFWFYAGQLRGRIDANICADKTAAAIVDAMNQKFGPPINRYTFTNLSLLTNTVDHVLAWEENTPCHYDRRWINLHGMNAMTGKTNSALSAPPEQWEAIRKRTRDDYASEFHKALALFNEQKH